MSSAPAPTSTRPAVYFLLPPPAYFAVSFVAGMLLQATMPLPLPDFPGRTMLGIGLLAAAMVGLVLLVATFRRGRTTLNPFGEPSRLFTAGPYRFSRNPMYVGLFVAYVGGCLLVLSVWPVLLLAVPALVLDRVVIPHEEATLRQAFGADFDAYCARVRRWIGRRGR